MQHYSVGTTIHMLLVLSYFARRYVICKQVRRTAGVVSSASITRGLALTILRLFRASLIEDARVLRRWTNRSLHRSICQSRCAGGSFRRFPVTLSRFCGNATWKKRPAPFPSKRHRKRIHAAAPTSRRRRRQRVLQNFTTSPTLRGDVETDASVALRRFSSSVFWGGFH